MKSYDEGKKIYNELKSGKRKQFKNKDTRAEIEMYKIGYMAGYSRGYAMAIKNNLR